MELLKHTIKNLYKSFPNEKDFLNETWSMAREEAEDTSPDSANRFGFTMLEEKFGEAAVQQAMRA